MDGDCQIEIPYSFALLFMERGVIRPNVDHAYALARYELCEDLSRLVHERAHELMGELYLDEETVRTRLQGCLAAIDADITREEREWVLRRVVELFGFGEKEARAADAKARLGVKGAHPELDGDQLWQAKARPGRAALDREATADEIAR